MILLIILAYFIIGFAVGLFIYDYHCKDYININKYRQFKLTWNEYANKEDPGFSMVFGMCLWPIILLFAFPMYYVKKHNGIK